MATSYSLYWEWLLGAKRTFDEAAMSESAGLGHCIGFGAFVSPSNAFVVYDPNESYPVKLGHWETAMGIKSYTAASTAALALGLFFTPPVSIAIDATINTVASLVSPAIGNLSFISPAMGQADAPAAVARKDYVDRRRRQAQGQEKAKAEGRYKGRPEDSERNDGIARMLASGQSWGAIQSATGCSRATIAKIAKRLKTAA